MRFCAPFSLIRHSADALVPASACARGCRRPCSARTSRRPSWARTPSLAASDHGLDRSEALVDALSALHRYAIAPAAGDLIGHGRAAPRGVLCHVRHHLELLQLSNELRRVITLVQPRSDGRFGVGLANFADLKSTVKRNVIDIYVASRRSRQYPIHRRRQGENIRLHKTKSRGLHHPTGECWINEIRRQ